MAEAAQVAPNHTDTEFSGLSSITQRLESHVSVDAAPSTPSTVFPLGIPSTDNTCSCQLGTELTGYGNSDDIPKERSYPLPHSNTYPQFCQTCRKPTRPINTVQSCSDLSTGTDSEDEDDCPSIPGNLNVDYYDVMMLYAEEDIKEVDEFMKKLAEIKLSNGESISAVLYDDPVFSRLSGLKLEQLDMAFRRCQYTFVYLTKTFFKNVWGKLASESCIMRTIYDKKQNWRVVPVYTKRHDEYRCRIPMGLNALKGVNYYIDDKFYRKAVSQLIENTLPERKLKQERLKLKRERWNPEEADSQCQNDMESYMFMPEKAMCAESRQCISDDSGSLLSQDGTSSKQNSPTYTEKTSMVHAVATDQGARHKTSQKDVTLSSDSDESTTKRTINQPEKEAKDGSLASGSAPRVFFSLDPKLLKEPDQLKKSISKVPQDDSGPKSNSVEIEETTVIRRRTCIEINNSSQTQSAAEKQSITTTITIAEPSSHPPHTKHTLFTFQYHQLGMFCWNPKCFHKLYTPFSSTNFEKFAFNQESWKTFYSTLD